MKTYRVKPEYVDQWFGNAPTDEIDAAQLDGITEGEINRLAMEWGADVFDLLGQVDIDPGYMAAAVELMDDDIRESLHRDGDCDTDAQFLREYETRHYAKYGERFGI